MPEFLTNLSSSGPFIPHGHCYLWNTALVWLHLLSDASIALAYFSIPLTLLYFVKNRKDVPFAGIFLLFSAFIIACGMTHLMEIWTLWHPTYWLSGSIKALTAIVSLFTAMTIVPLVPQALALPSPAQRESTNQELKIQIKERERAEVALRRAYDDLELRIQERTAELAQANEGLKAEVADRQRTEAMLQETTVLQRAILDSANYTIISTAVDGTIRTFNRAAQEWLGYTETEVIDRVTPALIHDPEEVVLRAQELSQELGVPIEPGFEVFVAKARRGEPIEGEWSYIRKDGSRFPVELSVTALRDGSNNITGFLGIGNDITDRKQAEKSLAQRVEELARSNAELEQFAYIASHDLQEPLRMVVSYLQLLERRYRGKLDPSADEFIAYAVDGATRMQTLIRDLLGYSRIGTQAQPFERMDSTISLDTAIANLKVAIAESNAIVTHDPLPEVMADKSQLVQLFQNLIGNGIKFRAQEPPRIHVSAERIDNRWQFSVRDNGIGIESQYTERIFAIFQRLHRRADYAGTGIGLAICKKIVERHGGTLWLTSEFGKGSTFYFTLPDRVGTRSCISKTIPNRLKFC
jgi:PAS domain S-box-containing protein